MIGIKPSFHTETEHSPLHGSEWLFMRGSHSLKGRRQSPRLKRRRRRNRRPIRMESKVAYEYIAVYGDKRIEGYCRTKSEASTIIGRFIEENPSCEIYEIKSEYLEVAIASLIDQGKKIPKWMETLRNVNGP